MTARDLLIEAAQCGLPITARGDRLAIKPTRLLTPGFADVLRSHKSELLELLASTPRPPRPLTERELAILAEVEPETRVLVFAALEIFPGSRIIESGSG